MQMNEMEFPGAQPVDGYGPGFFRIGGTAFRGSVLSDAAGTRDWGGYDDLTQLLALEGLVDVIVIGTGSEIAHIPTEMRNALDAAGIGVETMNSPAACRTYNVLVAEGRRVALAAIPV